VSGTLDQVIEQFRQLSEERNDSGVWARRLSNGANGSVAALIVYSLIQDIRNNGGYFELHGGLGVTASADLAGTICSPHVPPDNL